MKINKGILVRSVQSSKVFQRVIVLKNKTRPCTKDQNMLCFPLTVLKDYVLLFPPQQ